MRKLAIGLALASSALATPALATDNSWYAGIEGGLMIVQDMDLDYEDSVNDLNDAVTIDHKTGFDVDLIAGYDFGWWRLEGELGWKHAGIDTITLPTQVTDENIGAFDADGDASALSAMLNAMVDFGEQGQQIIAR